MATGRPPRRGFTLLELLVVVLILGVMLALLLCAVQRVREASLVAACQNNLRQLGIAAQNYEASSGTLPPYSTGYPPGAPVANWLAYLLPYVDAQAHSPSPLPKALPGTTVVTGTALTHVQRAVVRCPSDRSTVLDTYWATTNYLANWYVLSGGAGGYYAPAQTSDQLSSGSSNLVLFAEAYAVCDNLSRMALTSIWYHNFGITQQEKPSDDPSYLPEDYTLFQVRPPIEPGAGCDKWRTQTPHAAMNVGLADGSVRSVQGNISPTTWKLALKPRGATPLPDDW